MHQPTYVERLLSDQTGAWSAPLRMALSACSMAYGIAVAARNRRFDRPAAAIRIPLPVISVGNITAGGTGKTPMVIHIVERLIAMGAHPAVVARGYKARRGEPNDEELLIRSRCPNVAYLADPNRVRAARIAIERGAGVVVLDDGFQHRRIARDLDIVLIDSTRPFGNERLLPRGLLREPLESLHRASAIVLTRCDQADPRSLDDIASECRKFAPTAPMIRCRHRVIGVERMDGTSVDGALDGSLRCSRVVLFGAIARPASFIETARTLGVEFVGSKWWPDHHHYHQKNIHDILIPGRMPRFDFAITTEKDAVKLATIPGYDPTRILVIKVRIDFHDDGVTIFDRLLTDAVARSSPK